MHWHVFFFFQMWDIVNLGEKKERIISCKARLKVYTRRKTFLDVYEGESRLVDGDSHKIFVLTLTTRDDAGQKSLLEGKTLGAVFVFSRMRPLISFLFLLFYLRGLCECHLERTLMLLEAASGKKKKSIFISANTRRELENVSVRRKEKPLFLVA